MEVVCKPVSVFPKVERGCYVVALSGGANAAKVYLPGPCNTAWMSPGVQFRFPGEGSNAGQLLLLRVTNADAHTVDPDTAEAHIRDLLEAVEAFVGDTQDADSVFERGYREGRRAAAGELGLIGMQALWCLEREGRE